MEERDWEKSEWEFTAAPASKGLNQSGDLIGYNPYSGDRALTQAISCFGGRAGHERLVRFGDEIGSVQMLHLAKLANNNPPRLRRFDRLGNRLDHLEFHPSWHHLMQIARGSLTHALPWSNPSPDAHLIRAALSYLLNQGENGICCPITMSFASHAVLSLSATALSTYGPKIFNSGYDPRRLPAQKKHALTVGMAMTEQQGGSDLRETRTRAEPAAPKGYWRLNEQKWFFSVPQSDLILTLARTTKGISCFLAEGWQADGKRNGLQIQRLKDKCGNRSNAAAEVVFCDLHAVMIGEDGRGIPALLGMAHLTRFDCAISSAAIMRQALTQAIHHCSHRCAFGQPLIKQALMCNVLADMALDCEAFMWATMRLAQTLDHPDDEYQTLLGRIAIPVMKYLACKRAPVLVAEALECHGGNGYIEDHFMARLYREAPLNSIWEGSGNIICLDVLRAMQSSPDVVEVWQNELSTSHGFCREYDRELERLTQLLAQTEDRSFSARRIVESMGRLFQAHLLIQHAPVEIAETFCVTRFGAPSAQHYGALPDGSPTSMILERATLTSSV